MEEEAEKKFEGKNRIFFGEAYLQRIESKTYGLFRPLLVSPWIESEGRHGPREKLKVIGPIGVFRECEGSEKPDLMTFHPEEKRTLNLKSLGNI